MGSEQRRRLIGRIDELLDDDTEAAVRTVDGWEGWFVAPGYAPPAPPPPPSYTPPPAAPR